VQTTGVSGATGVHNLYLVFVGKKGIANVKWFTFTSTTVSTAPTDKLATSTFDTLDYASGYGVDNDHYNGISGDNGNWAEYGPIDFGTGVTRFEAEISGLAKYAGKIQIRIDSPTGTVIGTLSVSGTGSWSKNTLQTTGVSKVTGIHSLYLVFDGAYKVEDIRSFTFA
jgi:arabinoxylan arabinofuranohydrolase